MSNLFKLEIVTPDRKFYDDEVEMVIVRTTEGDIGVLKNHESLVAPVSIGGIRVKKDGVYRNAACAGGFISVGEGKATVITDSAEWQEEIDISRAEEARIRAEKRLEDAAKEVDVLRAQISLKRATNRIRHGNGSMSHDNL